MSYEGASQTIYNSGDYRYTIACECKQNKFGKNLSLQGINLKRKA